MARLLSALLILAATIWTYAPVLSFAFLNWDDHAVIVDNTALGLPGALGWALTTFHMEHYQPLSWVTWAAVKEWFGLDARAFHAANLLLHVVCAWLVAAVTRALVTHAGPETPNGVRDAAATAAALLFALHPLRVEVVAWISAFPYTLALALMLGALLVRLHDSKAAIPIVLGLYAASLAARPVGLGFPVVLAAIERWIFGRSAVASLRRAAPFGALAIIAAVVESMARAEGYNDLPLIYRLQSAATAPFVYLWLTIAPLVRVPIVTVPARPAGDVLVLASACSGLIAIGLWLWARSDRSPTGAAATVAYLALLAPAAGLVASGLQIVADRYAYVPGAALAISAGVGVAFALRGAAGRRSVITAGIAVFVLWSAVAARTAAAAWSDSIALWTTVASAHPADDVALYNLANALAAAGRTSEAADRYRQVLAAQPQHAPARANLDRLDALRLEREAGELAARGNLAAAADQYAAAITLDPARRESYAGRGMALSALGRDADALPALREAFRRGNRDVAMVNTLAALLAGHGQLDEAVSALEAGLETNPRDVGLSHNLARLLATRRDASREEAARALRLATEVADATNRRDPRALDTLAAALAANGRAAEANEVRTRAIELALEANDLTLARAIQEARAGKRDSAGKMHGRR